MEGSINNVPRRCRRHGKPVGKSEMNRKPGPKTAHALPAEARIQLRLPHQLKRIMQNRAKAHGMKLTAWILSRCA